VYEQSLLHAIHDQSEQMLSIKAERNNYRKIIVVEETRAGRLFIGLMKIDSAMKEVQKGINRAIKKKTKMLQRQAKILVKLKKVEENIERIQGEIEVMQEEIKVCFDRPHLTRV
jgi:chromosome segregation ATPase